jgi:hypothetical protein
LLFPDRVVDNHVVSRGAWLMLVLVGCGRIGFETIADTPDAWPDAIDAACRRELTFDNSAQGEALVRFPAMVALTPARIDYARARPGGEDLRFVAADGTAMPHEREVWEPGGSSTLWVQVPRIEASARAHAWMYYGDPAASDGQRTAEVWDASFEAVWHLAEDPSAAPPQISDSTAHARHGTVDGGMASSARVVGQVGRALVFDGLDDRIDVGAILGDRATFTVSLWFRTSSATVQMKAWGEGNAATNGPLNYIAPNENVAGDVEFCFRDVQGDGGCPNHQGGYNDGTWHHAVAVQRGRDDRELFVDGTSRMVNTTLVPTTVRDTGTIGAIRRVLLQYFFAGALDELRLSSVARSAHWIAADHRSQTDTFVTFGPEECRR